MTCFSGNSATGPCSIGLYKTCSEADQYFEITFEEAPRFTGVVCLKCFGRLAKTRNNNGSEEEDEANNRPSSETTQATGEETAEADLLTEANREEIEEAELLVETTEVAEDTEEAELSTETDREEIVEAEFVGEDG